jgi:16S rRNA processing protein RimM
MDIDSCYQLGYVIKPHGLKGDISIFIDADDPQAYRTLESVFIQQDKQLIPFFISQIKISGQKAILTLEESNNIDDASSLKGSALYLPLTFLPVLTEDQFYFHEIIGYVVKDGALGEIGIVTAVYDIGPQDLLAINYQGKEVLLPINDETISKVEKLKETIIVNLPEGLLDIYTSEEHDED